MSIVQWRIHTVHCSLHTTHYTLYTAHYTMHTANCTPHCTLHTVPNAHPEIVLSPQCQGQESKSSQNQSHHPRPQSVHYCHCLSQP